LAARNAVFIIKGFYISTSRFTNEDLSGRLRDGSTFKMKELETPELLKELANKNMYVRGMATVFLGRRQECSVPEALLKVMSSDESLCVRREALKSFQRITRGQFDVQDVFGFQEAQKWYEENRVQVRKRLECKDEEQ
jgi:hypothetical protein